MRISHVAHAKRKFVGSKEAQECNDFWEKPKEEQMNSEAKRIRVDSGESPHHGRSEDELFIEMISKSLSKIAEGEAKEALKIDIQNLVFKVRFGQQRLQSAEQVRERFFEGDYAAYPRDSCHAEASNVNRRKSAHPQKAANGTSATEEYSMVSLPMRTYEQQE